MTIFLSNKPDLTDDDSNYKNLSDNIISLKKCIDKKVNAILLFDSTRIDLKKSFAGRLDFLIGFFETEDLEEYDCHDTAYMLTTGKKRNTSGPFDSKELKGIGCEFVCYLNIKTGNDGLIGSMDRIFARDKLVREGKISVRFTIDEKDVKGFEFKIGDIITFSFIMNGGHSMIYLGKKQGKDMFLSKLGVGQLSIHDIGEIYEYYGLSEALIFRNNGISV